MPLPQIDWAAAVRNRLVAEQRSYDIDEQAQLATQCIPTLNPAQRSVSSLCCFFRHCLPSSYWWLDFLFHIQNPH